MTLSRFQKLLTKVNPKLKLRHRGYGDIVGLYGGSGYILRMTKGELHANGYRFQKVNPDNPMQMIDSNIQKRGRKTVINMLRNWRWINHHKDRTLLMFGVDK